MTLVRNVPGSVPAASTAVAARAVSATKTYGKGDGTVIALNQVDVEFAAGAFTSSPAGTSSSATSTSPPSTTST